MISGTDERLADAESVCAKGSRFAAAPATRPLKITHVVAGLYFGGIERLLLETCQANPPWHTSILAIDEPGPLAADFKACGVTVHCLDRNGAGHLHLLRVLRKHFRKTRPDVVHVHTYVLHALVALAARWAGVPSVVVSIHEVQRRLGFTSLLWDAACWAALPMVDRQIAVSEAVYESLARVGMPRRRTMVVYNGIGCRTSLERRPDRQDSRAGTTVAGTVIRLDAAKDYSTFLRAARMVLDHLPLCEFWVVGDGPERAKAQRLADELGISRSVKFLGHRRDVDDLLAKMDIFVFPATAREGLGVALLEAMHSGLPCVASDAAACPEIIQHGTNGLLYRCSDSRDLAAQILLLAGNSGLRNRIARNARETVRNRFNIQRTVEMWRGVYQTATRVGARA